MDDITQVDTAQRIVDAAREAFGDVHVLVNNAGICRDKMFTSMTETDWDDVMRVHLRGHFCLSSVLARVWRDAAKAGNPVDARIVNTSSGAGLQGSIGQSNYGAAKAGIAALTLMQAAELQRYGVRERAGTGRAHVDDGRRVRRHDEEARGRRLRLFRSGQRRAAGRVARQRAVGRRDGPGSRSRAG